MGRLTTHILDTAHGCPGNAIKIELYRVDGAQLTLIHRTLSNADGRCDAPLLQGDDYLRALGVKLAEPPFLDEVPLDFGLADVGSHYHVPLLISPYSYSTYRGS